MSNLNQMFEKPRNAIKRAMQSAGDIQYLNVKFHEAGAVETIGYDGYVDGETVSGNWAAPEIEGTELNLLYANRGWITPDSAGAAADNAVFLTDRALDPLMALEELTGSFVFMCRWRFAAGGFANAGVRTIMESTPGTGPSFSIGIKNQGGTSVKIVCFFYGGGTVDPEISLGALAAVDDIDHTMMVDYNAETGAVSIASDGDYANRVEDTTGLTHGVVGSARGLSFLGAMNNTPVIATHINDFIGNTLQIGDIWCIRKDTAISSAKLAALFTEFHANPTTDPWQLEDI